MLAFNISPSPSEFDAPYFHERRSRAAMDGCEEVPGDTRGKQGYGQGVEGSLWDASLGGSQDDMLAHFADAVDMDTAKQAFFIVVRYLITEERHENRGLTDIIGDLVVVSENAGY